MDSMKEIGSGQKVLFQTGIAPFNGSLPLTNG